MVDQLNPETGKQDGIYYTLGGSKCARTLNQMLVESDSQKLGKVHHLLQEYKSGLEQISQMPSIERPSGTTIKNVILDDWRDKYIKIADNLLTLEQGKTFLLNLIATEYRKVYNGRTTQ